MTIRTRMAPSPTGEYHVGHIRTVLYNYALTKKLGGKFIIRIEDTDRVRFVEGATERILEVIGDYGLSWDEGPKKEGEYGPYVQSERLPIYKKYATELVEKGAAYYCFCSTERLEALREEQHQKGFPVTKYDKHCLNIPLSEAKKRVEAGEPYVIRLNVPQNEEISFDDEVYGKITINSNDIDDQVLLKSDGFPSYHLGVVVDDHLMKITHIMRGNDWLPSTPKHVLLYKAFGWEMPKIIHLPNLKELGGSRKLSKRYGSVFATEFLKEGYLPEALLNFLMFLGWNPGTEKEIYSLEEFIADFSIDRIQKTDLVAFDRTKLLWMNGVYIRNLTPSKLLEKITAWSQKFGVSLPEASMDVLLKVLSLVQERMKVLSEFESLTKYFFADPIVSKDSLLEYCESATRVQEILSSFIDLMDKTADSNWNRETLDKSCHTLIAEKNYKPKEAFMTLRLALTGEKATPQIFDVLEVLGKKRSLDRLKNLTL